MLAQPNWDIVAQALGGTTKAHSIYCRFDALKKKATPGFGEDIPDLEELIARHIENGTINKKGKGAKAKKTAEGTDAEDDEPPPKAGKKRAAPTKGRGGKKAKVAGDDDEGDDGDDLLGPEMKSEAEVYQADDD